jgi:hypothetical protein
MSDLDLLLSARLEEPADMGFSSRVMIGVAELRLAQARRQAGLSLVIVALVLAIGLTTPVGTEIARAAQVLIATPAVWIGILTVMLSTLVWREVAA